MTSGYQALLARGAAEGTAGQHGADSARPSAAPAASRRVRAAARAADPLHRRAADQLGLDRFALYVHDYGAPIGLRLAAAQRERVTGLITQSGNA